VILVEEGVSDNERERSYKPVVRYCRVTRRAKSAGGKVTENRVFSEVRDLADDQMDDGECFGACVWKQPEYERADDARCVVGGEIVR